MMIFVRSVFFFILLLAFLCLLKTFVTQDSALSGKGSLFILSLSSFFGLLLSLVWQVFSEKRAYEKYIITEIKEINELYKNNVVTAMSLVFEYLSRSKNILRHPAWVLVIGSKKEKIDSSLLSEDCTAQFLSGCVIQLRSSLRFGEHDGGYDKLLGIFLDITQSLNYPAKCGYFPEFKLVEGGLSSAYLFKENILPFKLNFFFQQLREIRNYFEEKQDELKKEIQRLEKLELEDQE